MIFPKFENIEIINSIRKKYDPLAKLVAPHITIVFPFESNFSNEELERILEKRLEGIHPFEIELCGFHKCEDRFGNYLFLDMIKGKETITKIHNHLYNNELSAFDLGLEYIPHITVGKIDDIQELNNAYEEIRNINCSFVSMIDTISVEMIGDNEESIIVIEKKLR